MEWIGGLQKGKVCYSKTKIVLYSYSQCYIPNLTPSNILLCSNHDPKGSWRGLNILCSSSIFVYFPLVVCSKFWISRDIILFPCVICHLKKLVFLSTLLFKYGFIYVLFVNKYSVVLKFIGGFRGFNLVLFEFITIHCGIIRAHQRETMPFNHWVILNFIK